MTTPAHPHCPERKPNALASCSSPYLLQHAHNPVDWKPWGNDAFREARERDVPIFLSVGYSTCYWCHVMERESFEDEETARVMNELFVCVKLDREERPDVDEIYMAATVLMRGHGGWPMSVFLEPGTLRPFWCGTYFPKRAHAGGPSFTQVLQGMSRAYREQREDVRAQAASLAEAVAEGLATHSPRAPLGVETVQTALSRLLAMHDRVHGGFGTAPKFPQPVFLEFLLDARDAGDDATRAAIDLALRTTLDAMARGGIHDHLGGGFHRYSVDATWTVPHFEKMLYDQAQLLAVYARASVALDDAWYADIARAIVAYVQRDMRTADGLFASAEDAEVNGREGRNYLWTPGEAGDVLRMSGLSASDAKRTLHAFGLDREPNFQDPHHPDEPPRWVLRVDERPDKALAASVGGLFAARESRPRPHKDDKAITSWNAMLCAAMIEAGVLLGDESITRAGLDALDRLATLQLRADGSLARCRRAGRSYGEGVLEDSGAMLHACALASRVGDREAWLARARSVEAGAATRFFGDAIASDALGAMFDTPRDQSDLFVRACATHDGALPSGFSTMLTAMLAYRDALRTRSDSAEGPAHEHADAIESRVLAALALQSGRIDASPVGSVGSVRALLKILRAGKRVPHDPTASHAKLAHASLAEAPQDAVQVFASVDRVTIARDQPAQTTIAVHIAPGFHIVAADPGDDAITSGPLTPFRIDIVHGTGVVAYADYPAGEPLGSDGPLARARGYTGTLEILVALERDGEWQGTPLLGVRYQACGPDACFVPRVVELDIALDRA